MFLFVVKNDWPEISVPFAHIHCETLSGEVKVPFKDYRDRRPLNILFIRIAEALFIV